MHKKSNLFNLLLFFAGYINVELYGKTGIGFMSGRAPHCEKGKVKTAV